MSDWRKFVPPAVKSSAAWKAARSFIRGAPAPKASPQKKDESSAEYWTRHNVTLHKHFSSAEESLDYLDWRTGQYFGYGALMPVSGCDRKKVLDFGCGPGHDLVGFGYYSKPELLVGADVSPSSIGEAKARLALHNIQAEFHVLGEDEPKLPYPDATFDYVHSSGVIHHVADPIPALRELRRVLKASGEARIMIYNRESLFFHLYVAYERRIEAGQYKDLALDDAFRRLTDGPECPVSRAYTPEQFLALAKEAGFEGTHLGNAVSAFEMLMLPKRYAALLSPELPHEHRAFLRELTFDEQQLPLYRGKHAGIDGCFSLRISA